jgi:hypothetical protein
MRRAPARELYPTNASCCPPLPAGLLLAAAAPRLAEAVAVVSLSTAAGITEVIPYNNTDPPVCRGPVTFQVSRLLGPTSPLGHAAPIRGPTLCLPTWRTPAFTLAARLCRPTHHLHRTRTAAAGNKRCGRQTPPRVARAPLLPPTQVPLNISGFGATTVNIASYFANGTAAGCGAASSVAVLDAGTDVNINCTVTDAVAAANIKIVVGNSTLNSTLLLNGTNFWPAMNDVLAPVITVGDVVQVPALLDPLGIGAVNFTVRGVAG